MSPRHFARVFRAATGATPARYVEQARVEAARRRLEESDDGVDAIAARLRLRHRRDHAARVPARRARRPDRLPPPLPGPRSGRGLNERRPPMGITTGIVLFDGAEELDFAGPWEVFTMGRREGDRVVTIAEHDRPIVCAKGLRVLPDHTFADAPALDVAARPRRPRHAGSSARTRRCSTASAGSRPAAPGSRACAPARSCSRRPGSGPGPAGHHPLGLDRGAARAGARPRRCSKSIRYVARRQRGHRRPGSAPGSTWRSGCSASSPRSSTPGPPSTLMEYDPAPPYAALV